MSATMPPEYVDALLDFFVEGAVDETTVWPTVRGVLGREPRRFDAWLAENVDSFR